MIAAPHLTSYTEAIRAWLDQLLVWQVAVTRHHFADIADDQYRGLYIPDAEVDILTMPDRLPDELVRERQELTELREMIEHNALEQDNRNAQDPLRRLGRSFQLSPFECDVLALALAPEIDLRYERLYAYIQDDVTRKRPSVDLALRLFCVDPGDRLRVRQVFAADASLRRNHLIQLLEDGQRNPPLLARAIKLDDRILAELLNQGATDSQIAAAMVLERPTRSLGDLVLSPKIDVQLRQLVGRHAGPLVLALQGTYGSGRGAIARALCHERDVPLLNVDLDRLIAGELTPTEALSRVVREAQLTGAGVLWQGAERVLREEGLAAWRAALLGALDAHRGLSCLPLEQIWEARGALRHAAFLCIPVPTPSYSEREQIWRQRLNGDTPADETLHALASTFRLTGGQIRDAITMARELANWRGGPVEAEDLATACRAQSTGKLDALAHKIRTTYTWDDIVLPADELGTLHEICAQVRHRQIVLERWGFERRLAMGKGVNVLFAGQSGTGKTMAAEIVAADLGLELYKVDLSTMVSKYIGETEKNLDRIFTAAREANTILFFDEADAIFGKRSEVKDAHDRYANIEVGYLLQKMEEYDGVVILATNFRKNLDDAFLRRLHVAIEFPFPEESDRLDIWHKVFPVEAPLAEDVDLTFMARQFKLAGGNIRNIALLAAYLAATDDSSIRMVHVVHATKREYQKLGKLITESDFGPYLALLKRTR